MPNLELMVARMVAWAHAVEQGLHDSGPWTFRTPAASTPAHRIVDNERAEIIFTGVAPPRDGGSSLVELWCGDTMVSTACIDPTRGDRIKWRMSLKEPAAAS